MAWVQLKPRILYLSFHNAWLRYQLMKFLTVRHALLVIFALFDKVKKKKTNKQTKPDNYKPFIAAILDHGKKVSL